MGRCDWGGGDQPFSESLTFMDIVDKPWGKYQILLTEGLFQVKRIEVNPDARLSLQKHTRRSEKWVIVQGNGIATVNGNEVPVKPGSYLDVPIEATHRIANVGSNMLVFIEIQLGEYLGEDDIVRLEDDYNRA
jgi:mannose-6-phosphate isomerase-like protein (cupin superfamily)